MALSFSAKTYLTTASPRSFGRLLLLRSQSNIPSHPNPTDLSDDSTTDALLRKLEDAIHRIIVRRAAPDWLPFLPGSSYWVPPPRSAPGSLGIAQLVEKLANPLTDEESLSTSTSRGASPQTIEVKMTTNKSEAEASSNKSEEEASPNASSYKSEAAATSSNVSKFEDEEG